MNADWRYVATLARSVFHAPLPRPSRSLLAVSTAATVLLSLAAVSSRDAVLPNRPATGAEDAQIAALTARTVQVGQNLKRAEQFYRRNAAPLARVLQRYRDDSTLERRIAVALVREAREVNLDPRLLLAVLLVENPGLDPSATSSEGAVGLMQVMPFHLGQWPPCGPRLDDVNANICYGARIFAHYLNAENGNPERALLRYNGCVKGTNTPDCKKYPYAVYARAGRASILAWLQRPPALP